MDPLTLLLLVIIILAGGFIGMFADHLGRKIGKKKLSFRSMRPKHVARLGTFFAGIAISALTIVLVFFTSSDVREWITRGHQAIKDAQVLRASNAGLEDEIRVKTSQIDRLDRDAKVARESLSNAQKHLADVKDQLSTANSRLADATRRVEIGKRDLALNQKLLRQNQALLKERQADLKAVAAKLSSAQAKYATLRSNYGTVNRQRVEAEARVVSLGQEADTLTSEVAQLRKDSEELKKEKEAAMIALQDARSDLNDEQVELKGVQSALKAARDELETAQLSSARLRYIAGATRSQPITFQLGQEIQRLQINPNLTQQQARQAVEKLMSEADKVARQRGATTAPGSLLSVFFPTFQNGEEPAQIEDAIVNGITGQDHEVVLIALSSLNTFQGECVPVTIIDRDNPIVYHKDEVLAELKVGKNWPEDRVIKVFTDFMKGQVQDKIKTKMIPVAGQEDSLINVEASKTINVVEHLTRLPRDTMLQVRCLAETRAADSLQLDFKYK